MTESTGMMHSSAPWPDELDDLVRRARAFIGWTFHLENGDHGDGTSGLRLVIVIRHYDSYHPERGRSTAFVFPVPAATFDRASWQRWLFDRCIDVWRHETGEALGFKYEYPTLNDDPIMVVHRPFAPFHGPGRDPNRNVEVGVHPHEARVPQEGVVRYDADKLYHPTAGDREPRYLGWWWNGLYAHTDEEHDHCSRQETCIPVQRIDEDRERA